MGSTKAKTITEYNELQSGSEREVCVELAKIIDIELVGSESKIWHGSPVWFIKGNPIVSYSKLKAGIKLMFFSGADFGETLLSPGSGKFMDASITYTKLEQLEAKDITRWLKKARDIQWDYKNVVKNKGKLYKL